MMPKKSADTITNMPVQTRICIKKKKMGKAARASTIKKRALLAESRQWVLSGKLAMAMMNALLCKHKTSISKLLLKSYFVSLSSFSGFEVRQFERTWAKSSSFCSAGAGMGSFTSSIGAACDELTPFLPANWAKILPVLETSAIIDSYFYKHHHCIALTLRFYDDLPAGCEIDHLRR